VVKQKYTPDRGDVVWLEFSPQAGTEQRGKRPAFVLSPKSYNLKVGLALFCPITSKVKGYPFEVLLPQGGKVSGAILVDHVKSLDWRARKAAFIQKSGKPVTEEVLAKLLTLIA
jgi:mRNA interferase MazF